MAALSTSGSMRLTLQQPMGRSWASRSACFGRYLRPPLFLQISTEMMDLILPRLLAIEEQFNPSFMRQKYDIVQSG